MQKIAKNSPSGHHRTLSGYIFATRARIDNRKKPVKLQYLPHTHVPHTSLQYGELRHTSAGDLLASLGHPSKFQRVLHLGSVTARHSISGRLVCQTAALNRGRQLYLAKRPSRLALAHIVVLILNCSESFILVNQQQQILQCCPCVFTPTPHGVN